VRWQVTGWKWGPCAAVDCITISFAAALRSRSRRSRDGWRGRRGPLERRIGVKVRESNRTAEGDALGGRSCGEVRWRWRRAGAVLQVNLKTNYYRVVKRLLISAGISTALDTTAVIKAGLSRAKTSASGKETKTAVRHRRRRNTPGLPASVHEGNFHCSTTELSQYFLERDAMVKSPTSGAEAWVAVSSGKPARIALKEVGCPSHSDGHFSRGSELGPRRAAAVARPGREFGLGCSVSSAGFRASFPARFFRKPNILILTFHLCCSSDCFCEWECKIYARR